MEGVDEIHLNGRKNWDFLAPENCQQETENTEHTVLKRQRKHPKKKDTKKCVFFFALFWGCFFLFVFFLFGNRLSFPVNEKEDISTIQ